MCLYLTQFLENLNLFNCLYFLCLSVMKGAFCAFFTLFVRYCSEYCDSEIVVIYALLSIRSEFTTFNFVFNIFLNLITRADLL